MINLQDTTDEELLEAYKDKNEEAIYRSFERFSRYNARDVEIIVNLDNRFKYIELANNMVHEATVNFSAVFGSVQLIDSAIINFCHLNLKKIVFDRTHRPKQQVEGALVLSVKKGLHGFTASCDIKSLYPSTYRTLNLSPEMIIGQLMGYESDWRKVYEARCNPENDLLMMKSVTLVLEGTHAENDALQMTVGALLELMEEKQIACSAYGTLLDQSRGEGLIPSVLSYWFSGRVEMKDLSKKHSKIADGILKESGKTPEYLEAVRLSEYYDMLQGVRKVLLNSSYGATLNEWCRFHDPRLGASTTGSGRQITTFMLETITEQLVGHKIPLIKVTEETEDGEFENAYTIDCPPGLGPVMADTDSTYFLMDTLLKDIPDELEKVEMAVQIADAIVAYINIGFNKFTALAFNCQPDFIGKIEAAREIVAISGIIRAKKNYAFLVKDNEGKRYSTDKLKFQGGDLKVKTTPEVIRKFLEGMTMRILKGVPREDIEKDIIVFRDTIGADVEADPLAYGTVYTVKNLDVNQEKWRRTEKVGLGKVKLTGHDRAAINYNYSLEMFAPNDTQIIGGGKVKIICLMDNEYGFKTMGFPSEFEKLPQWFNGRFRVDLKLTEIKMVDGKVGNTFIPIGWTVPTRQSVLRNSLFEF